MSLLAGPSSDGPCILLDNDNAEELDFFEPNGDLVGQGLLSTSMTPLT